MKNITMFRDFLQETSPYEQRQTPAQSPQTEQTNSGSVFTIISGSQLMNTEYPPLVQAVQGLIVEGLTILAGEPKIGKSFLMLDLVDSVANGRPFLGREVTSGDVLYLALEDSERRLKEREKKMQLSLSPRLGFVLNAPTLKDGLLLHLEQWVKSVSEPRLIVIDTFECIRDETRANVNAYSADYKALLPLQRFAISQHLALVIVHHVNKGTNVNKFARINGTNGISGAVDAQIIMTSDNGQVTLTTRGREIEMEEIPLKRIGARWECNSPEAIARELYEKDPVITFIRYLKAHSLQPNHWQQSIQYEEFRQGTNQYFGKPILNTANETGKKLRSLESDLLRYDGISATNDRSIGGKRGVIFRA